MVNLYLVRHGETEENVAGLLQGLLPGTLTRRGREQAAALCGTLRSLRFDAFYVSDLRRTVQTAEILRPAVGRPFVLQPLLRERDWGSLTGTLAAEAQGREFPPDVESVEQMAMRAARFLNLLRERHSGASVLAVTHGLFVRCLLATYAGLAIRDIPRMQNAEMCLLRVEGAVPLGGGATLGESGASAN